MSDILNMHYSWANEYNRGQALDTGHRVTSISKAQSGEDSIPRGAGLVWVGGSALILCR